MTDPSDHVQESLREFLHAEKARPNPSLEIQQRVLSRLSVSLGLAPDLGNAVPTSAEPDLAPASVRPGILHRIVAHTSGRGLATFLVGAAIGATTYGTVAHFRHPAPPASPIVAAVAPPAPERPHLLPTPEPRTASASSTTTASKPAPSEQHRNRAAEPGLDGSRDRGLAAERKLIEMARTSLTRSQTDSALAALRRHSRQFPHGQLAEERESLLVQALVAKGEFAQARERATRFYRQHPQSLFTPVVDQALKSIP